MASTTKIMTSILAIESGELDETVTTVTEALTEGTSIGLKEGYKLTLESLVYGMMLESGNDAANLCALYLGGSFDSFADMMNEKARQIGMDNTNFVTPSGLDDEEHYSTAYDMALLGAYSIKNRSFREICSLKSKSITFVEPEINLTFYNHNRLLSECEGVFGIKTGFTKKSGRCLVTACERNGVTLICVTLSAPDDWNDHKKLYDGCFAELTSEKISEEELLAVPVYGGVKNNIHVFIEDFTCSFKNKTEDVTKVIYMPKILYAPVYDNQCIGKVEYYYNDILIGKSDILSLEYVNSKEESYRKKFSIFEWIKDKLNFRD